MDKLCFTKQSLKRLRPQIIRFEAACRWFHQIFLFYPNGNTANYEASESPRGHSLQCRSHQHRPLVHPTGGKRMELDMREKFFQQI